MHSLFEAAPPADQAGYRLAYLEVLNWGTFDGLPIRLELGGRNALLTGANGAGKTTLLDALLTLLVPPTGTGRRIYNAAAGTVTGSRRDEPRTDESYVLGYFSQNQRDNQAQASPEALRDKRSHSILLACFENATLGQHLTVAQVLRFRSSAGELRTDFILIPAALGVADLGSLDGEGRWRKQLTTRYQAEFFPTFPEYGTRLRELTGMREKALTLFGRSVALKELTSLNHFVRHEMLSAGRAEEHYRRLRQQYEQLLATDQAIRQATRQVELLAPVPAAQAQWEQARQRGEQAGRLQQLVRHLLQTRATQALQAEQAAAQLALDELTTRLTASTREREAAQTHKENLAANRRQHQASRQLDALRDRQTALQATLARQQATGRRYASAATELGFTLPADAATFSQQHQQATERAATLRAAAAPAAAELAELTARRTAARQHRDAVTKHLQLLKQHPGSKIPAAQQAARQQLLVALAPSKLTVNDLPFAGELVQVRPAAEAWEPALEALLRPFALQLLVPAAQYPAVVAQLTATNLGVRLRYRVLPAPDALRKLPPAEFAPGTVGELLTLHPASPLRAWLGQQLRRRFPHHCAAAGGVALGNTAPRAALTPQGRRRRGARHVQDDRPADPSRYVLGWDNQARQLATARQLAEAEAALTDLHHQHQAHIQATARREAQYQATQELLRYLDFAEVDAATTQHELTQVAEQAARLAASSDQLRELDAQLTQAETQVQALNERLRLLYEQRGSLTTVLKGLREQAAGLPAEQEALLPAATPELLAAAAAWLPPAGAALSYAQWQQKQIQVVPELAQEAQRAATQLTTRERRLRELLEQFARPSSALSQEFPDWYRDVPPVDPDPDHCAEFTAVLARLQHEALPPLQAAFARYFGKELAINVISFRSALNQELDELTRSLRELNAALQAIDFHQHPAPTYLQLVARRTTTPRVAQFRQLLRAVRADLNPTGDAALAGQATYADVKHLLTELADDAHRREVTDVRNWLDFSAQEFVRPAPGEPDAPGTSLRVYENSNSLSKGQRAQLTYTVLGAAVAHQFGIRQQGLRGQSFRLLAIDEAFGDLDADNSVYLMELCRRLHLQVLVVSPLDKIALLQPYLHSCHVVASPDRRTACVYTLTAEALASHLATPATEPVS